MKKSILKSMLVAVVLSVLAFSAVPSCMGQNLSLNEIVSALKAEIPLSLGALGEMTDISIAKGELLLTANVDESVINIKKLQQEPDLVKENMRQLVMNRNAGLSLLIDAVLESNLGLRMTYIGNTTGKKVSSALTYSELRDLTSSMDKESFNSMLESQVSLTNAQMPMDIGNGMIITRVARESEYVIYYVMCDESQVDLDALRRSIPISKNAIKDYINSDDPSITAFRNVCKDAGVGIGYCYVGKSSGNNVRVLVPVDELK